MWHAYSSRDQTSGAGRPRKVVRFRKPQDARGLRGQVPNASAGVHPTGLVVVPRQRGPRIWTIKIERFQREAALGAGLHRRGRYCQRSPTTWGAGSARRSWHQIEAIGALARAPTAVYLGARVIPSHVC
jgi:hypothetical protein